MRTIELGSPGITRAYVEPEEARAAEAGDAIKFVATTEGVKRDGLDLRLDGLDTTNFERNPVFLWVHSYTMPPIGKVTKIRKLKKRIEMYVEFDQNDEFALDIERKYREGFLTAVSIGWIITEYERAAEDEEARFIVTRSDLLDLSAVPVPGDPDALMPRELAAVRAMHEISQSESGSLLAQDHPPAPARAAGQEDLSDCEHLDDDGEVDWNRVAAEMARLLDDGTLVDDDDREARYVHLTRHYRKMGRTAPELLPGLLLDSILVRDLFLEGEWAIYNEGRVAVAKTRLREALAETRDAADEFLRALDEQAFIDGDEEETTTESSFVDLFTSIRDALVLPNELGEDTDE